MSKINRGEVLVIVFVGALILFKPENIPYWFIIFYAGLFTFFTDKIVLMLKKKISRQRPLITVIGKVDANPDMKHSFPSAHSANSMTVLSILVFGFTFPPFILLFSFMAGIGRLFSLHHFFSDVIGGWFIGMIIGLLGISLLNPLIPLFFH